MKPRLYLETSIISYLAALPSRDLVAAAHQQLSHEWWNTQRSRFDLHISGLVHQEVAAGDQDAARCRLLLLVGINRLEITEETIALANKLAMGTRLPPRSMDDAIHVATAAIHGMDFLLTWNCRHLANVIIRMEMEAICRAMGLDPPLICTPEELMGEIHGT